LKFILAELVRPYFAQVTPLIRAAQRAGKYVEGEPHHLQYLFIGAATRIFTLAAEVKAMTGRPPSSQRMIEEHVTACLGLFFRDRPGENRSLAMRSARGGRGAATRPRPGRTTVS